MEFMGHSMKGRRLPTALGVYGHVTDETYEQARQAIDKALFRPRPVRCGGTEGRPVIAAATPVQVSGQMTGLRFRPVLS